VSTSTSSAGRRRPPTSVDLFATAALASMQLLELITAVEDDFRVRIDERDIQPGGCGRSRRSRR
jgi:acyl carrier protein